MSSWIHITPDDFADVLSAAEIDVMRQLADKAGDVPDAIFGRIIDRVTVEVREAIANNRANVLGESGTLPASLANTALDMLCFRLLKRFSQKITDERKLAYDQAQARLADIAAARHGILSPDGAVATDPASIPEIVASDPAYGNGGAGIYPTPDRHDI